MRILIVNKYLYPRGGDCIYTLRLMKLLTDAGHTVIPFSMHHPQNIKTIYSKYFVPYIDFKDELNHFSINNAFKVFSRSIVNKTAVSLIQRLIEDYEIDVVHLQNIHHQLTPAILDPPYQAGIPFVWTMHDYTLLCPDSMFFRNKNICTECASGNNVHAILHRCKKGSLGASLVSAIESTVHRPPKLIHKVDRFISPSQFLKTQLVKHGFPEKKVKNVPNFQPPFERSGSDDGYFLFAGSLSDGKGLTSLLKAFLMLNSGKLLIAGDGPERHKYEKFVGTNKMANVEFLGFKSPNEVKNLIASCRAVVVPSEWYENFPYSVLEAMASGKPVIGTKIGGIPEQIEHDRTGLLFEPGNIEELAWCMAKLHKDKNLARKLGQAGYDKTLTEYSPETHYQRIMKVYHEVTDRKENGSQERKVQKHIHSLTNIK